jgi:acetyl esterase/lipase
MTLRFGAVRVSTHVHWPRVATVSLALVLTDELSATDPLVANFTVVTLAGRHPAEVEFAALQWLGDHAGQLSASAEHVLVAGGAHAARLAVAARDSGWPALERQLIVHPRFFPEHAMPTDLAGVAAATVLCSGDGADDGRRYAARLRHAGVPVQEVHDGARALARG